MWSLHGKNQELEKMQEMARIREEQNHEEQARLLEQYQEIAKSEAERKQSLMQDNVYNTISCHLFRSYNFKRLHLVVNKCFFLFYKHDFKAKFREQEAESEKALDDYKRYFEEQMKSAQLNAEMELAKLSEEQTAERERLQV